MTEKKKAWEIMEKINGHKIRYTEWASCSVHARNELVRKSLVVVDEVIESQNNESNSFNYWNTVKDYLKSF